MRSPCLACDLKDQSKDNPVCKECDERVQYVDLINGIERPDKAMRVKKQPSSDKLRRAELYIQSTCEKHLIDLKDLKSRKFSGNLGAVRRDIAHTLRYDFKLSMKSIGKLLNKSQQAVSVILNPKEAKPILPPGATNTHTTGRPDQTVEESEPDKIFIIINFKDHPDIHEHLIKTAKTNFRKPEDHVLYLINKEREGSDEDKNTFCLGTESP